MVLRTEVAKYQPGPLASSLRLGQKCGEYERLPEEPRELAVKGPPAPPSPSRAEHSRPTLTGSGLPSCPLAAAPESGTADRAHSCRAVVTQRSPHAHHGSDPLSNQPEEVTVFHRPWRGLPTGCQEDWGCSMQGRAAGSVWLTLRDRLAPQEAVLSVNVFLRQEGSRQAEEDSQEPVRKQKATQWSRMDLLSTLCTLQNTNSTLVDRWLLKHVV